MTNITQALSSSKVPRIAKLFASSEYKLRNKAYKIVLKLLKSKSLGEGHGKVSQNELIAICKGLHYWLWMQDKALLHEEVVEKICKLVTEITAKDVCITFISTMLETEYREWDTLDKHRIDKFMMLVRDFFSAVLFYLRVTNYENPAWFLSILSKYLINTDTSKSMGLKMHFAYVVLEELSKAKAPQEFVEKIVERYCVILSELKPNQPFPKKLKQYIFKELLRMYDNGNSLVDMSRVSQLLFALGSKADTKPSSRKSLYFLSEEFRSRSSNDFNEEGKSDPQPEPMDIQTYAESPRSDCDQLLVTSNKPTIKKKTTSPKPAEKCKRSTLESMDSDILSLVNRITNANSVSNSKTPFVELTKIETRENIERKRVSFGKIFRKPFTKRDAVSTPSPSTIKAPDKGILKPKRLSFSAPKSKKTKLRSSL